MPIIVQNDLPAKQILESENIFVIDEDRATHQDVRPLQILILNLMPLKEDTELDLLRSLSNFPIQTQISFMKLASHQPRHTSANHLNRFYGDFSEFENQNFDGFIITGAPVENIPFEEVIRLDDVIPSLDLLYMTRVQRERFFNEEDYVRLKDFYILDKEKLSRAKSTMHVLHPLPRVNEISVDVDDDPRAAYFPQVQYGLFVRMALILTLLDLTDEHMNHGLLKW